jgi:hypothetical protein
VIDGLLTRVRGLWEWVEARWNDLLDFLHKEEDRRAVAARWAIAIALFFVALAALVGLGWLLRGAGLWGDLAFAIVVTTAVFWILRRLASLFLGESDVRALPRAFATTIFVLVGFPVAWVTRWAGLALLFLPVAVWAVAQFIYWLQDRGKPKPRPERRFPVFWHAEVGGVTLLAIVLFLVPSVGSADRVPQAVPADSTEAGQAGLELAERFKPLLFFDSTERFYPVDIQDAIAGNRVEMCRKAVGDDNCTRVENATLIDANQDYLRFEEAPGIERGGNDTSAIYYHVTGPNADGRVYVDYWWFYSLNPSPVADKVFCGPGLRTPPFTCQQHAGDWEGLTVVLAQCDGGEPECEAVGDRSLAPEEVRYGQHEFVVAYDWEDLTNYWESLDIPEDAQDVQEAWQTLVLPAIGTADPHAVAFVARNSHASYPNPCFGSCKQATRNLFEAPHNGAVPWVHNEDCDDCVKPLPLTREGDPALWNAFPGRWGEQACILAGAYCDLSGAPKGPSLQRRYRDPANVEVEPMCLRQTGAGTGELEPC